ncbi:MAG TPA: hypothetical protein VF200_05895 [Woeseiaceae bacterium]|jgi:hypothetical protein
MNVFTFVFLIVTVSLCAGVIKTWLEQRKGRDQTAEEIEQTLARIDGLEERIEVLERIITDKRVDLRQRIDEL